MTTTRDTSAIAEQTASADDPGTAPNRRADAPRTVEPGDSPSNPAAVHGIIGGSPPPPRVIRPVGSGAAAGAAGLLRGRAGKGHGPVGGPLRPPSRPARRPVVQL